MTMDDGKHSSANSKGEYVNPRVLWAFAAFVFIVAGCETGSLSRTEQARQNAHPQAVEHLLNAQQAYEAGFYNSALVLTDSATH